MALYFNHNFLQQSQRRQQCTFQTADMPLPITARSAVVSKEKAKFCGVCSTRLPYNNNYYKLNVIYNP